MRAEKCKVKGGGLRESFKGLCLKGKRSVNSLTSWFCLLISFFVHFLAYNSVTGSPSSEGIVKIIDFGQLEELHIARLWDPTVSTYDDVVPYGTPTDLKDVTTFFKSIVQAPCLTHLTITDPQIAAIPLRFEARQLRNVCLTALAVEDLVIDDGRAQLGSVHETRYTK